MIRIKRFSTGQFSEDQCLEQMFVLTDLFRASDFFFCLMLGFSSFRDGLFFEIIFWNSRWSSTEVPVKIKSTGLVFEFLRFCNLHKITKSIIWIVRAFWLAYNCVFIGLWSTKWRAQYGWLPQVVRIYSFMKKKNLYSLLISSFSSLRRENNNFI